MSLGCYVNDITNAKDVARRANVSDLRDTVGELKLELELQLEHLANVAQNRGG